MNETVSYTTQLYRSRTLVNEDYDMVRVTLNMKRNEWRLLKKHIVEGHFVFDDKDIYRTGNSKIRYIMNLLGFKEIDESLKFIFRYKGHIKIEVDLSATNPDLIFVKIFQDVVAHGKNLLKKELKELLTFNEEI